MLLMKPQTLYEVREPRCWKKYRSYYRTRRCGSGSTDAGMRVRIYPLCIDGPTAGVAAGLPGQVPLGVQSGTSTPRKEAESGGSPLSPPAPLPVQHNVTAAGQLDGLNAQLRRECFSIRFGRE